MADATSYSDKPPPSSHSSSSNSSLDITHHQTTPSSPALATSKNADDLALSQTKSYAQTLSPLHEVLFITLLCSTQFVTQVGLLNTLTILHIIGPSLSISSPGVLSWLVAGYSLTIGTFILLSGRCGDVFGYKPMVILGFVWFGLWNIVAGCSVYVAGNGGQVLFIFARVLGGIGPAFLLPNALGLLGATYSPGRKKDMVFSLFGACAPSGAVAGGTFAGLWSLIWWPWTFWTFGIALMGLAVLAMVILPEVPLSAEVSGLTFRKKLAELDLLGASVGITAMIMFNFAWNQAPGFGWDKTYIYVMLIVGILLFPVFFWIELKVAEKPLIPFDAFSSDVSFVLVCEVCGWASFGIFIYYFIQILQQLRGASPLLAMAYLSPAVISGFIAAVTTGHVISRIGPGWVMLISMLAFLIGSTLVATMPVDQPYWNQAFILVLIIPWGMDMSFPAGTLIMSDAVEKKHQGMAASLVNTVVNYSISIGVGIAGTVETRVNPGGGTEQDELAGYRASLYLGIGLSGMGVLTSILFLGKMELRKRRNERRVQETSSP